MLARSLSSILLRAASTGALIAAASACAPSVSFGVRMPESDAPIAGVEHETGTRAGVKSTTLFWQSWHSESAPRRAALVVMHGLKDHSSRYADMARVLVARGIDVFGFDLRGHGRSAGERVVVDSFGDYVDDLASFVEDVRAREPGKPVFVFGHSMGGAITALYAATRHPAVAGILLSAPGLKFHAPVFAIGIVKVSAALGPDLALLGSSNEDFCRDPAVVADMTSDPLVFQPAGPAHTLSEFLGGISQVWRHAKHLTVPLFVMHGSADTLTDPDGSEALVVHAASRDKTFKRYDGLYHDLVHEPEKAQVFADVSAWIEARIPHE